MTKPASGEARNATAAAMSSGMPTRPTGCCARSASLWSGSRRFAMRCQGPVSIHPGQIALTRISGPRLTARAWVSASSPPFAAA